MPLVPLLPFEIAGHHLAVSLDCVRRVLPALLTTPLPGAPETVRGLINVRGQVLPVVDLARRFGWPSPQRSLWQPFVWLKTSRRELVLPVETVGAVLHYQPDAFTAALDPSVPSRLLQGVVRNADGLLLIQDVEQLLSLDDEKVLTGALDRHNDASHESQ